MSDNIQSGEMLDQIFYYMNLLVSEKDFNKAVALLAELGRTLADAERTSFWYWDRRKRQYWTLAASESERITVPEGTGIVGASIKNCETIVLNEPYSDDRFNPEVDRTTGFVTRSIICMPVTDGSGNAIGAYQAVNKRGSDGKSIFNGQDVKRLTLAAAYSGKLLETRLLQEESRIDPLTGLKNRRGFYEYFDEAVKNSFAEKGLIMCDIDFFKKVNDTYGHNAGDAVLVMVSDIIRKNITGMGEVFRWGGEEFVVLFDCRDTESAVCVAENLRRNIEESACRYDGKDIRITMSFGAGMYDRDVSTEDNIMRADGRLYEAKAAGRNCVKCME